ncbi:hypothetical protein V499_01628, partial [Pseudogymnoascus sp. VKM F-103]
MSGPSKGLFVPNNEVAAPRATAVVVASHEAGVSRWPSGRLRVPPPASPSAVVRVL